MKLLHRLYSNDVGLIAVLCGLSLVMRLVFFSGYQGADDRIYLFYAQHYAATGSPPEVMTNWIGRIGAWLPIAVVMRIAGAGEISAAAYPLACSLLLVVVVFYLGKLLFDRRTALLAGILSAFFPLEVIYSTTSYADVPVGFFQTLSLYLFLRQYHSSSPRRDALLAGIALGAGLLCRETAVFSLAPMGCIALFRPRLAQRAALSFSGVGLVLLASFAFWWQHTGDALYQFHATKARAVLLKETLVDPSDEEAGSAFIPRPRASEQYRARNTFADLALMFLVNEEFALFYIAAIPVLLWQTVKRDAPTRELRASIGWLVVLCAFFPLQWFKFTVPRDPRYYVCLTGPVVLCLAHWLQSLKSAVLRRSLLGVLLACAVAALALTAQSRAFTVKHMLHDFQRAHRDEPLWCSSEEAAAIAVYSRFSGDSNVGIHFFDRGALSNRFQNYRLYRPDVRTVTNPEEIDEGYVTLPRNARIAPLPTWREVGRFTAPVSPITSWAISAGRATGVPKGLLDKLLPGAGDETTLYHVERQ